MCNDTVKRGFVSSKDSIYTLGSYLEHRHILFLKNYNFRMAVPLVFYQIPWSHYCDKVRWALDLKEIPYEAINYKIFGRTKGLERSPKAMPKLMPMIEDDNQFRYDSTPILLYLDEKYPQLSKELFPSSSSEDRQRVIDTCLRLDSELGLYSRRIAYVEMLNEKSSALSILLGEKFSWAYNPDDIRSRLISPFISCFMIARFRLHRIREEHLREKTESILLEIGDRLSTNTYLVGEQFSAADLTFCSLVKPLQRVRCFRDDQRFRVIFDYHERIRRNHDPKYPNIDNFVEKMADEHRARGRKYEKSMIFRIKALIHRINFVQRIFIWIMTMAVGRLYGPVSDEQETPQFKKMSSQVNTDQREEKQAINDQRVANVMSVWLMITFFFRYFAHLIFTIPDQAAYLKQENTTSNSVPRRSNGT